MYQYFSDKKKPYLELCIVHTKQKKDTLLYWNKYSEQAVHMCTLAESFNVKCIHLKDFATILLSVTTFADNKLPSRIGLS